MARRRRVFVEISDYMRLTDHQRIDGHPRWPAKDAERSDVARRRRVRAPTSDRLLSATLPKRKRHGGGYAGRAS